jgi:hypothetical protein
MNTSAPPIDRSITSRLTSGAIFLFKVFVLLEATVYLVTTLLLSTDNVEYIAVGVSGGLQDGFPEHTRLDYHAGKLDEVQAIFLGRAVVRGGYKAYLDEMQPTWRQYTVSHDRMYLRGFSQAWISSESSVFIHYAGGTESAPD